MDGAWTSLARARLLNEFANSDAKSKVLQRGIVTKRKCRHTHTCVLLFMYTHIKTWLKMKMKNICIWVLAGSKKWPEFDYGISISKILILNTMSCLITIYNFSSDFSSLCTAHYSWVMCLWIVLLLRAAICEPIFLTSRRPILDMIVASFLFQPSQPLFFLADGI